MGAATVLTYMGQEIGEHQGKVKCAIYDSGFSDLRLVVDSFTASNPIAGAMAAFLLPVVNMQVKKKTGLDIETYKPKVHAEKISIPGLFLQGSEDGLIVPQHTAENYEAYGDERKNKIVFSGDHNDE